MAPERKTIAQILRCSEDQASAFARRVQEFVGAPVPTDLIAAAMLKVRARDLAVPQRVAEYITQEMERQAKGTVATKRATARARPATSGEAAAKKSAARTKTARKTGSSGAARTRSRAKPEANPEAAPDESEAPASSRARAEQLEKARVRSMMTQLDRLLEENWTWASTQNLEAPPKRWSPDEFVREVHRRVFSDKAPRARILKVARELHRDEWVLSPGAVADRILAEIKAKEGE
jgi:hypothetical protein